MGAFQEIFKNNAPEMNAAEINQTAFLKPRRDFRTVQPSATHHRFLVSLLVLLLVTLVTCQTNRNPSEAIRDRSSRASRQMDLPPVPEFSENPDGTSLRTLPFSSRVRNFPRRSRESKATTLQRLLDQEQQRQQKSVNPPSPQPLEAFSSRMGASLEKEEEEERGRSLVLGNMIEQLSSALHRNLIRGRSPSSAKMEGREQTSAPQVRKIVRNNEKEIAAGLGGGNQYYRLHPEKKQLITLPECATQQVCNAVYVRLNMTQPLCSCPALTEPCSASLETSDRHTIELKMGAKSSTAVTLIKTCEPVWSVRDCRAPRDWSILALQNTRTGKAHYLVICKCPDGSQLDGPLNHDQPSYAQVPGIRVFGMMCIASSMRAGRQTRHVPDFPWHRVESVLEDRSIVEDLLRDEEDPNSRTGRVSPITEHTDEEENRLDQ